MQKTKSDPRPARTDVTRRRKISFVATIHMILIILIATIGVPVEEYLTIKGPAQAWESCGARNVCAKGIMIEGVRFSCTLNVLTPSFSCPDLKASHALMQATYIRSSSLTSVFFPNVPSGILLELTEDSKIVFKQTFEEIKKNYYKSVASVFAFLLASFFYFSRNCYFSKEH